MKVFWWNLQGWLKPFLCKSRKFLNDSQSLVEMLHSVQWSIFVWIHHVAQSLARCDTGTTELHAHPAVAAHVLPQQGDQSVPHPAEHSCPCHRQPHYVHGSSSRLCQRYSLTYLLTYTSCIHTVCKLNNFDADGWPIGRHLARHIAAVH